MDKRILAQELRLLADEFEFAPMLFDWSVSTLRDLASKLIAEKAFKTPEDWELYYYQHSEA